MLSRTVGRRDAAVERTGMYLQRVLERRHILLLRLPCGKYLFNYIHPLTFTPRMLGRVIHRFHMDTG